MSQASLGILIWF